jgi:hypothetical protein
LCMSRSSRSERQADSMVCARSSTRNGQPA